MPLRVSTFLPFWTWCSSQSSCNLQRQGAELNAPTVFRGVLSSVLRRLSADRGETAGQHVHPKAPLPTHPMHIPSEHTIHAHAHADSYQAHHSCLTTPPRFLSYSLVFQFRTCCHVLLYLWPGAATPTPAGLFLCSWQFIASFGFNLDIKSHTYTPTHQPASASPLPPRSSSPE